MGIISGFSNMVKNAFGLDGLKSRTTDLKKMAKELSTPETATNEETFEEALVRLNMTEEDIHQRELYFKRLTSIFILFAILIFVYLLYLLFFKHAYFVSLGCVGILMIIAGQIFRYNFWLFQMRERRLGCTFREWLSNVMGRKK